MGLGQKLEKIFYQERQTSTGINCLETSWLKSSYLAEQSAFPRKEGTGQVWGSLEKTEVGENAEGALQDLLGWEMLTTGAAAAASSFVLTPGTFACRGVPRAAVAVAPGMLCLSEGVWTHLVILAGRKDPVQARTAKGAF